MVVAPDQPARVLVIGSGAREHAIVRALVADEGVGAVWCAPGNPGTATEPGCEGNHEVDPVAGASVSALASDLGADLVVIGPEAPLVAGVADAVRAAGIACFGPSAAAARLEGSKAFAKEVMAAAGVPTAMARVASTPEEVEAALDAFAVPGAPFVVKEDGLAAGKGVVVTTDRDAALAHGLACVSGGSTVVVEEFLDGPEVSLFVLSDGVSALPLEPAQDFKRVGDGGTGPNTGGMGAYSPLPWAPPGMVEEIVTRVAQPVLDEMAARGTPFVGVLYCGLALTARGVQVVEFNARFGDPETQVVLARLRTPLGGLLRAAATGGLAEHPPLVWAGGSAVTVVVAAHGYPGTVRGGDEVVGLDGAAASGAAVLHAGTTLDGLGRVVSSGGRVLSVVGVGADLEKAREVAYGGVGAITLEGSHHRSDVARAAALRR